MKQTLRLDLDLALLEDQVLAHHPLPDVLDIVDDGLEVRGRVVGACDVDIVSLTRGGGSVQWGYRYEPSI